MTLALDQDDWIKMRELMEEVVDRRITESERRADAKFATKDDLEPIKWDLADVKKRVEVIELELVEVKTEVRKITIKLDDLTDDSHDNRNRIRQLERQAKPAP